MSIVTPLFCPGVVSDARIPAFFFSNAPVLSLPFGTLGYSDQKKAKECDIVQKERATDSKQIVG